MYKYSYETMYKNKITKKPNLRVYLTFYYESRWFINVILFFLLIHATRVHYEIISNKKGKRPNLVINVKTCNFDMVSRSAPELNLINCRTDCDH